MPQSGKVVRRGGCQGSLEWCPRPVYRPVRDQGWQYKSVWPETKHREDIRGLDPVGEWTNGARKNGRLSTRRKKSIKRLRTLRGKPNCSIVARLVIGPGRRPFLIGQQLVKYSSAQFSFARRDRRTAAVLIANSQDGCLQRFSNVACSESSVRSFALRHARGGIGPPQAGRRHHGKIAHRSVGDRVAQDVEYS